MNLIKSSFMCCVALMISCVFATGIVSAQSASSIWKSIVQDVTEHHEKNVKATQEEEVAERENQLKINKEIQSNLKELGYAPGPIDGLWGKKTERALKQYIKDFTIDADPRPTKIQFTSRYYQWRIKCKQATSN